MRYAAIVFANSPEPFTYAVPEHWPASPESSEEVKAELKIGDLVAAPLRGQVENGIVVALSTDQPDFAVREIERLVRAQVLTAWQVEVANWVCAYYAAHAGKTLQVFVPKRVWEDRPLKRKAKLHAIVAHSQPAKQLNHAQQKAVTEILEDYQLPTANCQLLYGITGSGKTEVYLRVIQEVLSRGQQAILLVPEIALTPQLVGYFAAAIPPEQIAVIHSQLAEGTRLAAWEQIRSGEVKLVIGSRSALFAPATQLGIIVLDEEHEWTYKSDQAPRYHARAVALKIAELTGARLVLGSATPSLETWAAAQSGKIKLVELSERIGATPLPAVKIIDLRHELKKQNYSLFSEELQAAIHTRLAKQEQVILLLNKRGYSSSLLCRDCGAVATCRDCAVPLARHRSPERLLCHYCGLSEKIPLGCPTCGSVLIKFLGSGTQKLEHELAALFPKARILRADRDTTSQVGSHAQIYAALRERQADILVGTQIVAKGLDLPGVSLVGVLNADIGLHLPDFRAAERTFDLLTQVAGRAGRREIRGEVLIQSYCPAHPALQAAARHDYLGFATAELAERQKLGYPPYRRMVKFSFVSLEERKAKLAAEKFAEQIRQLAQAEPDATANQTPKTKTKRRWQVAVTPAPVVKKSGKYFWLVIWRGADPRELLSEVKLPSSCRVDVDPMNLD